MFSSHVGNNRACHYRCMDIFDEIADERRAVADLLSGLTVEQQTTRSLCSEWTVHDVAAHLVMPFVISMPKVMVTMVLCGGSFDRANVRLTREVAKRPLGELVELLGRNAASRFTPPGAGPEAPLTDVLVHGLDIRWPLGVEREIPTQRLLKALNHLSTPAGLAPKRAFDGLRLHAVDIDWSHGDGPNVRGPAQTLLLAMAGRTAALEQLSGDGVDTLTDRLL